MISKCIAVLAVLAQVYASDCNQPSYILPSCGSFSSDVPAAFASSDASNFVSSGPITRNIVARGKYSVALSNCGPSVDGQVPITTSHVTAQLLEKPTVRLPASIPAPRTIAHSCTCYKTILRPRVHQQIISVPTVQRYIETVHKPVVENVQYEANAFNCNGNNGVQMISAPVQAVQAVQAVQVPQIQTVQVPQIQTVQVPQIQTVQVPQIQTVQSVPTFEAPVQTVQVPQVQFPQSFSFGSSCNTC